MLHRPQVDAQSTHMGTGRAPMASSCSPLWLSKCPVYAYSYIYLSIRIYKVDPSSSWAHTHIQRVLIGIVSLLSGNIKPLERSWGEAWRAQKWYIHKVNSKKIRDRKENLNSSCILVFMMEEPRGRVSTPALQHNTDVDMLHWRWCSCTCCSRMSWCQINGRWQMQFYKCLPAGSRATSLRGVNQAW